MTLIKKSDVHRHLSTKSRKSRGLKRPYALNSAAPVKVEPVVAPAEAALVAVQETPAK